MKRIAIVSLIVICAATVACSSRGVEANRTRFSQDVGTATAIDAYERTMRVIRLHQFQIEREIQPPNLYIETRWRERAPFEDERGLGISQAQVRVIVRGTSRSATSKGELFSVNVAIENRVQLPFSTDWTEETASGQYRKYAQRIVDDLKRELEVGVRRY